MKTFKDISNFVTGFILACLAAIGFGSIIIKSYVHGCLSGDVIGLSDYMCSEFDKFAHGFTRTFNL